MECKALGQLVTSKAGRDKGRYFFVVGIVDEDYVLIADGDLRKISSPKKKKIKHLVFHDMADNEIFQKIKENRQITDAELRKCLESIGLLQK